MIGRSFGTFEVVARRRPVRLVVPDRGPARAPYVAAQRTVTPSRGAPTELTLKSGGVRLTATLDERVSLGVTAGGRTTTHRSRRSGRPGPRVSALALTLTGPQVMAWTLEDDAWVARAGFRLTDRNGVPAGWWHDPEWLAGLEFEGADDTGRFGQLGLRDLRAVSHADGTAYVQDGQFLLTASSAGPAGFRTGHASVWSLDPRSLELEHRADLFFRRRGGTDAASVGVYGDHAVHLLRDVGRWLVAASTWGDFDRGRAPVAVTLSESDADLTRGTHVLDARELRLPTDPLTSVGVWDPHLVRNQDGWLVGYVSATRYFRFHPVLAHGPDLDSLELAAAASMRHQTEGPTLIRAPEHAGSGWLMLASDRRQSTYPVLDLALQEVGTLEAAYHSNIPWPTMLDDGVTRLLVGFDGSAYGGRLVGYGSHGDVVVQRATVPSLPPLQ